jgi:AraC-like DNA-binding protein
MDEALFIDEMSRLMEALSALTGLSVRWKRPNGLWFDNRLPRPQCLHLEPFCEMVKGHLGDYSRCLANDSTVVEVRARAERKPFRHRCHAGAVELFVPLFTRGDYDGYLQLGPMRPPTRGSCPYPSCRGAFRRLPMFREDVVNAAQAILVVLGRYAVERKAMIELQRQTEKVGDSRIQAAIGHVVRHCRQGVTVAAAARRCGLSPSRFIHLFKEECGMPFSVFVARTRIEAAKALLGGANLSIDQVARECGFASQSYFGVVFRRHAGMTPKQYRRQQFEALAQHGSVPGDTR